MSYFEVTGTDGEEAIINSNAVSKVIDYGSYRSIYQGSDTNHYNVTASLTTIAADLGPTGYFEVTGTDGSNAILSAGAVSKVIDYGSYRSIYQGSDTNHYNVTAPLATILSALQEA